MNTMISPEVRKALAVGAAHFWAFQFIGYGVAPTKPTYMNGWVVETVVKAPEKAQERLAALEMAGITVTDIIVAHEAPKLLGSPTKKPDFKIPPIVPNVEKTADVIGQVFGGLFGVMAVFGQVMFAILPLMFFPLLLIDPAVIVRLSGGEMLLVTTWVE